MDVSDLDSLAVLLLNDHPEARIFAFSGELGAGKTTFIQVLCRKLGVTDVVNSPTFAIINEYRAADGYPVYHFDFYRIRNIMEALDLGLDEYFSSGCYCFIEWPENIGQLLPREAVYISILPDPATGERKFQY